MRRRVYPLAGTPASLGIPRPKMRYAPVTIPADFAPDDPLGLIEATMRRAEESMVRALNEAIFAPLWRWETASFPARPGAPEPPPFRGLSAALGVA